MIPMETQHIRDMIDDALAEFAEEAQGEWRSDIQKAAIEARAHEARVAYARRSTMLWVGLCVAYAAAGAWYGYRLGRGRPLGRLN